MWKVIPTLQAHYKKPKLIFRKFADDPVLMEALKSERHRRVEKMETVDSLGMGGLVRW
jgi:hypothetical protein